MGFDKTLHQDTREEEADRASVNTITLFQTGDETLWFILWLSDA